MIARYSSATERALERFKSGETMYSAAKNENIAYNTLWRAVQRLSGMPPDRSTVQRTRDQIQLLRITGKQFVDALAVANKFAMGNDEYAAIHAESVEKLIEEKRTIFDEPTKRPRGRPRHDSAKRTLEQGELEGDTQPFPSQANESTEANT